MLVVVFHLLPNLSYTRSMLPESLFGPLWLCGLVYCIRTGWYDCLHCLWGSWHVWRHSWVVSTVCNSAFESQAFPNGGGVNAFAESFIVMEILYHPTGTWIWGVWTGNLLECMQCCMDLTQGYSRSPHALKVAGDVVVMSNGCVWTPQWEGIRSAVQHISIVHH